MQTHLGLLNFMIMPVVPDEIEFKSAYLIYLVI